ncbi:RNA polymerase sigma-I factor [Dethiobacter alkaliphilus]|uniref:RNA polymerase sigma-I factor n=1 Tax=Dethiobacter alkaliphilus TaxID=427926 RepID=UPI0022263752|nr:RNA polymerase sigma-I factor [Dethiobacter alkaliphilus]MCW3490797.1 RNA polymerase sigma-I factor [Dethiobacter alkaliphilus]
MLVPFRKNTENSRPDEYALLAQQGDSQCRDYLLESYRPYVMRVASRYCRRYILAGTDEEFSVALLAFNEAIDSYRSDLGKGFLSFARLVIERRLADYCRKNTRRREVPFSGIVNDEEQSESLPAAETEAAEKAFAEQQLQSERQAEIIHFSRLLSRYGITLDELVRISPKHRDARQSAMAAAKAVAENEQWFDYFKKKNALPLKSMEKELPVSRKTLERQRKYIVALLLVYVEDLPHMREYLKGDE